MACDLARLPNLSETTLLEQLQCRFHQNEIYTYVADILVAVNPYSKLKLYSPSTSSDYTSLPGLASRDPHIFALADRAYQSLKRTGKRQCFLISGESGAGKTESTKLILQHILRVSRHKRPWIQDIVSQVNPILEALGNARTLMNHNSSRFGKYIQLFCEPDGVVTGLHISHYILERSRIVMRNEGDFNFHIFYFMFAGLPRAELLKCLLVKPTNHRYLQEAPGVAEYLVSGKPAALFEEFVLALGDIGFTEEEVSMMWRVLAAVLHIGDIKFSEAEDGESCVIRTPTVLTTVCKLLNVEETVLSAALTSIISITRGETIQKFFGLLKCDATRDGLAKTLYGRLFDWVVHKINTLCSAYSAGAAEATRSATTSIEILDIFGFENFERNSFEQLCINTANEQLQFFFNQHIFTWEQTEYKTEGVQIERVEFCNNEDVLDLLLTRPIGTLQLLDEESRLSKGTDQSFLDKLEGSWRSHPSLEIPHTRQAFTVTHYAGKVSYCADGVLDKNRECLSGDVARCFSSSSSPLLVEMFCGVRTTGTLVRGLADKRTATLSRAKHIANMTLSRPGKPVAATAVQRKKKRVVRGNTKRKEPTSVAMFFRSSLKDLMKKILEAEPHFIRCIKPNTEKRAMFFDPETVRRQLKYTGVVETTRIRQQGYPTRLTFEKFTGKYGAIVSWVEGEEVMSTMKRVLEAVPAVDGWVVGHTKVFLKYWYEEKLDREFDRTIRATVTAQKVVRGYLARRIYQALLEEQEEMRKAEEAQRLEEERKHAEILEQLAAEQRLRDHLESIRCLTEKTADRAGTLDLKTFNLTDLTSAIFDTTDMLGDVEDPTLGTLETLSSLDYRGSYHPAEEEAEESPIDNTLSPTLLPTPDITEDSPKIQNNNTDLLNGDSELLTAESEEISETDKSLLATATLKDSETISETLTSGDSLLMGLAVKDSESISETVSETLTSTGESLVRGINLEDILADIPPSDNIADITPTEESEIDLRPRTPEESEVDLTPRTPEESEVILRARTPELGMLDTLDRTLEAELEKLARWSRDSFSDPATIPTTLSLSNSKQSTMESRDGHVISEIKSEPITALDSLTRVSFVSVTPTNPDQTSLEAVLETQPVTNVSTFSLNTLGTEEEEGWRREEIRSVSTKECSLKLSLAQTLSHGEVPMDLMPSPCYQNLPDGRAISPGEALLLQNELQDSGVEMPRFDSLESGSSSSQLHRSSESGRSSLDSREKVMASTPKGPPKTPPGIPSSGSMNSFEDQSCSSPSSLSELSQDSPTSRERTGSNVSGTSVDIPGPLPHPIPHPVRSRSAASNASEHYVTTTLDRPRARSVTGAPIKQAWLEVCCYERDKQVGHFLLEEPTVKIDGIMVHPGALKNPDIRRICLPAIDNKDRHPKTAKILQEIGEGVQISRNRETGNVTLTKLCKRDVFRMSDEFLALQYGDQKCKGKEKHRKLEQNTMETIFDKQEFSEKFRNSQFDASMLPTLGQIAIGFVKSENTMKGVPCWIKIQCMEAMNIIKTLAMQNPCIIERLKSMEEIPRPATRASQSRISFGKSVSKTSLKDPSRTGSPDPNVPIPRSKSKNHLFRGSKKDSSPGCVVGMSPEPGSRNSSHLEPFNHSYASHMDMLGDCPPLSRDGAPLRSRRLSSPPDVKRNITSADVSLPIGRQTPIPES